MLKTLFLIILSFFAVIGFIECVVDIFETISLSKYKCIDDIYVCASLSGEVEDVCFLLNTLMLQSDRINYKTVRTRVVVKDVGLDENTYREITAFCMENDNISIEK